MAENPDIKNIERNVSDIKNIERNVSDIKNIERLREYCKIDRDFAADNYNRDKFATDIPLYATIGLSIVGTAVSIFRPTLSPFFIASTGITTYKYIAETEFRNPQKEKIALENFDVLKTQIENFLNEKEKITPKTAAEKLDRWEKEYSLICRSANYNMNFRRM